MCYDPSGRRRGIREELARIWDREGKNTTDSVGRKRTASSRVVLRNVEYSILLVMSELSTLRCDRALGLWIVGTRASSVDGELPWRCCGRWTVWWMAVKGSRDRSSNRATAVASTPGSRAQAATEGGFLGLRHKTKEADGG